MTNIEEIGKPLVDNGWEILTDEGFKQTGEYARKSEFSIFIDDRLLTITYGDDMMPCKKHRLSSLKSIERSIKRIK